MVLALTILFASPSLPILSWTLGSDEMYIFTLPDTQQDGLERKPHFYSPFFLCVHNVPGRLISSDPCLIDPNSTLRRRLQLTATTTNDTSTVDTPTRSPPSHLYLILFPPLISLLPNSLALTNSATPESYVVRRLPTEMKHKNAKAWDWVDTRCRATSGLSTQRLPGP